MKFYEKCAAARAVLNWSRDDLSEKSGIPSPTIRNFERGQYIPKEAIQIAIEKAFSKEGIVFTDNGIEKRDFSAEVIKDYIDVLSQIEKAAPSEILFHCADDRRSTPEVMAKLHHLLGIGINMRSTIAESNEYVAFEREQYRRIPDDYFADSDVVVIYENRVIFDMEESFLLITSEKIANAWKRQFEYWWKRGGVV